MADTQDQTKSKKFNDFHSRAVGKQKSQDLNPRLCPKPCAFPTWVVYTNSLEAD